MCIHCYNDKDNDARKFLTREECEALAHGDISRLVLKRRDGKTDAEIDAIFQRLALGPRQLISLLGYIKHNGCCLQVDKLSK